MTVGALAAFVYPWRMPNAEDWALFALLGVLNGGAHYMMIEAHRWAEASVIAPFRYTALVWAFILGYFLWDDVPDAWLLSGSALVVGIRPLHSSPGDPRQTILGALNAKHRNVGGTTRI